MAFAEGTTVAVEKSRAEIEKLARAHGAVRFESGWDRDAATVTFELRSRVVRYMLLLPTEEEVTKGATPRRSSWQTPTAEQKLRWREAENRRRWRCLLLAIRGQLEAVENKIVEFDQAFLGHIVGPSGKTVFEVIRELEAGGKLMLGAVPS